MNEQEKNDAAIDHAAAYCLYRQAKESFRAGLYYRDAEVSALRRKTETMHSTHSKDIERLNQDKAEVVHVLYQFYEAVRNTYGFREMYDKKTCSPEKVYSIIEKHLSSDYPIPTESLIQKHRTT